MLMPSIFNKIYLMMIGLDFRFTDMQIKQRTEQKRSSMDIMRII